METLLDKAFETGGSTNKYQYIMLCLTLLIWINVEMVLISFPFLEKQPEVNFIDPITDENVTTQLNYIICEDVKNYTITKVYGHSWVSEFNIECSKFDNSLIGTLIFIGGVIGNINLISNFFKDHLLCQFWLITLEES